MSDPNLSEGEEVGFPLRIGETIRDTTAFGRHLVVMDVLGQGAYAVVYLVKDLKTGQQHALKCLSKSGLSWEQLNIQREEAKLHKSLGKHINIVHLDRYFENKNWLFLVLEYCPGRDLFCWIADRCDERAPDGRRRSTEERYRVIKDIFAQALAAVQYCHARGISHRDVKPENFIVCNDGVLKLADFGLATCERESDDFDCGSRPYMSHECLVPSGTPYSPRLADVWSLGILILTLLYRRTPWSEASDECAAYVRYLKSPLRFLQQEFGCDAMLASFLVRRVFCPAAQGRVGVADWLRMWYDDLILPKNTSASQVRAARRGGPAAAQLRQLLADIQTAKSLPDESRFAVAPKQPVQPVQPVQLVKDWLTVQPQPMLRRKASWSDLDDDTMDFSMPLVFDDPGSTAVAPRPLANYSSTSTSTIDNEQSTAVSSPVDILKHAAPTLPMIHVEPVPFQSGSFADSAFGSASTVSSHMHPLDHEERGGGGGRGESRGGGNDDGAAAAAASAHPAFIKAFGLDGRRFGFESRSTGGVLGYGHVHDEDDELVFSMD